MFEKQEERKEKMLESQNGWTEKHVVYRCWEPPPSFYVIGLLIVSVYLHCHKVIIDIYPVHWQFSYNVLVSQGQRGDVGLLKNAKHNLMTACLCLFGLFSFVKSLWSQIYWGKTSY